MDTLILWGVESSLVNREAALIAEPPIVYDHESKEAFAAQRLAWKLGKDSDSVIYLGEFKFGTELDGCGFQELTTHSPIVVGEGQVIAIMGPVMARYLKELSILASGAAEEDSESQFVGEWIVASNPKGFLLGSMHWDDYEKMRNNFSDRVAKVFDSEVKDATELSSRAKTAVAAHSCLLVAPPSERYQRRTLAAHMAGDEEEVRRICREWSWYEKCDVQTIIDRFESTTALGPNAP